ncbi:PSP1 C-terminal conserved region-domain-containing protein [Gamsiella multidivaricata]|uniref:PSP1 C-terminal conserved region-domain-containing protein n=1 Tax=Gamsiella multidivaricata TaxID=101098 RepID=UPI00221EE1DD|nr:PSP1 C-terminal conserved region-domain-containing protein [Gamsiella multidivaricata]KAI7832589.1 PSP1 C-terminal conserved region-domain-containing protein [Gamsiella multidivaricata]
MSLAQLSQHGLLYVVEFKAGRSDLFYVSENSGLSLQRGDLVMVEADRGKDLGKITNDSITPQQVQALQKKHAEAAAVAAQHEGQRAPKEIHPKRIFRMAHPTEIAQLVNKSQDEIKAMMVCQTKVRQKKLPMEVVDAEYQWDRRKLTFYFQAEHRIDFRELVRELFKIYKTRIWMYAVNPSMAASMGRDAGPQTSPPRVVSSPTASPSSPQPHHSILHHHHSSQQALHLQHPQQHAQHQQHQQHAGLYYQQPQLQDLMRQMQAQYFSTSQRSPYQGLHHERLLSEEESMHRPFYEQSYPLQPPHPLM